MNLSTHRNENVCTLSSLPPSQLYYVPYGYGFTKFSVFFSTPSLFSFPLFFLQTFLSANFEFQSISSFHRLFSLSFPLPTLLSSCFLLNSQTPFFHVGFSPNALTSKLTGLFSFLGLNPYSRFPYLIHSYSFFGICLLCTIFFSFLHPGHHNKIITKARL
ncbi:unnamed protein product [Citrullus colocynthis]|uniref:Uncharacterized protein n=1 Tax=Citrullus colocynthis TaxID=252529 RepID=A0ABP0YL95_9ROSI